MALRPPLVALLVLAPLMALGAVQAHAATAPVETIAGTGQSIAFVPPSDPSAPATSIPFKSAYGVEPTTFNGGGVVFADTADHRILQLDNNGALFLVAGTGQGGFIDNVAPEDARFSGPRGVSQMETGYIVADSSNNCTRLINLGLLPYRVNRNAGTCQGPPFIDDDANTFGGPVEIEAFGDGLSYYVADAYYVRKVLASNGDVTTVAGSNATFTPPADNASPTSGYLGDVSDVAIAEADTSYFIAASASIGTTPPTIINRVYKVTGSTIKTVAGKGTGALGDGASAANATLNDPLSVAALNDGGVLIYDAGNRRIRRVSKGATPTISTLVGNGTTGLAATGTPAPDAPLAAVGYLAVTPRGLVFSQTHAGAGVLQRIPSTAVMTGPSGVTTSRSASFTFGSWDSDASFQCRLGTSGAFGTCAGLIDLPDGTHTYQVRATTNKLANGTGGTVDTVGASRTWTVDATPPDAFALLAPEVAATVVPTPEFSWQQATDATTGVARYELLVDGAKVGETTSCCTLTAPAPIPDGIHTWQIRAVDGAGNVRDSEVRSFGVSVPPVAALSIAPERTLINRPVAFDASKSSDSNGSIVRYEWDLDGNGSFETDTGGTATASRSYDKPQSIKVSVRVTDDVGLPASASGNLTISAPPPVGKPLGVSINDGAQYTNDPNVTVFAVWPAFASDALVSNDGGFKLAQVFPVAEQLPWKLDSSGPERLPKTIYVRYVGGVQTSETYTDDIILDETAPKVLAATLPAAGAARAAASAARRVKLKIRASDNVSGVSRVQVTTNKRKPGRFLRYKRTLKVKPARKLFVRARDRAGNLSRWRTAKRR